MTVATLALGLSVAANEKPSPEFQALMKSNAATNGALRMHIMAKDYDAIAADAATLKENFAKNEPFWTAMKADDALGFLKTGAKGAADLETAAKAKNDEGIAAASKAVASTCGGCHMAHRAQLPDKTSEIK
jgi:cytochrome c556